MNKAWIATNLQEAIEELQQTLRELPDAEYGFGNFSVAMAHAYHHLNTAWNSRDVSEDELGTMGDAEFNRWRAFPKDVHLGD
jgi:hypothetical protein